MTHDQTLHYPISILILCLRQLNLVPKTQSTTEESLLIFCYHDFTLKEHYSFQKLCSFFPRQLPVLRDLFVAEISVVNEKYLIS